MVRVGRYRLDGVLGVGSFATVHRACDDRLAAEVVVKVLAENHAFNPEIRERFIAEGRSLRRVDSPHVITVHDMGESEANQPYLVLDFADRGTLADRVASLRADGWSASRADVLRVARDLSYALSAVHAAGLVHRDLSPRNVLLKSHPQAPGPEAPGIQDAGSPRAVTGAEMLVVADLGMCKDLALNSGLTVAGGTAGFRPPEQEGGPGLIDHRADLWAMSRLLEWLSEGADLPRAFHRVLARSLADDPRRRHRDTRAWLADVEASVLPPRTGAAPASARQAAPAGREPRRRRPLRIALGAGALAAAFAAGTVGPPWFASLNSQDLSFAIDGPDQISVGETVSYQAIVGDAQSWVWILPNGTYVADAPEVRLTPRGPGPAEVTIQGRDESGGTIEVTKDVVVE